MDVNADDLLKTFKLLQEQRVITYKRFDDSLASSNIVFRGFRAYISSSPNYDFTSYRQLVHEVTEKFKAISLEIISIQHRLSTDLLLNDIAKFINNIQTLEESKLEFTAKFQLATQNLQDFPQNVEFANLVAELKDRITQKEREINEQMEEMKYEMEDVIQPSA